eukprot:4644363-Pyramimonas_sp.AAC.1
MQLAIAPAGDKWHVVKHIMFEEAQEVVKIQDSLAFGGAHCHYWWPHHPWDTKKMCHMILDGLGGLQVRYGKWGGGEAEKAIDFNNISAGHQFMRKNRPPSNNEGQYAEWVDAWTKKPESPILDWPEGQCRSFLECCARGASTAKAI